MDIQYEYNSSFNRYSYYARQADKKDTEKNNGISLVGSFSANDGSFGAEQPLQSDDFDLQNNHQNHCCVSAY